MARKINPVDRLQTIELKIKSTQKEIDQRQKILEKLLQEKEDIANSEMIRQLKEAGYITLGDVAKLIHHGTHKDNIDTSIKHDVNSHNIVSQTNLKGAKVNE